MVENIYRQGIEAPSDRIIVALDGMNLPEAQATLEVLEAAIGLAKFNSAALKKGWQETIKIPARLGINTMADPKLHDIPQTVAYGTQDITECGAKLITVHASGGQEMLQAAVRGRDEGRKFNGFLRAFASADEDRIGTFLKKQRDTLGGILGITVLTSLDESECVSIFGAKPEEKVIKFAYKAAEAGIDGIVCSALELKAIRSRDDLNGLLTVVPGITPLWAAKGKDQNRVATPRAAVEDGADFIVIGRAINNAADYDGMTKRQAAERIAEELPEAA